MQNNFGTLVPVTKVPFGTFVTGLNGTMSSFVAGL